MAKHELVALVNIGTEHQKQYGIPNSPEGDFPPQEGDVFTVDDENLQNILVHVLKCCAVYDAKSAQEHAEQVHQKDLKVMEQEVQAEMVREQIKEEAKANLKQKETAKAKVVRESPARVENK